MAAVARDDVARRVVPDDRPGGLPIRENRCGDVVTVADDDGRSQWVCEWSDVCVRVTDARVLGNVHRNTGDTVGDSLDIHLVGMRS